MISADETNFVRKEAVFSQKQFSAEIATLIKMRELFQAGVTPEATWTQIQSMVTLAEDYKDDTEL